MIASGDWFVLGEPLGDPHRGKVPWPNLFSPRQAFEPIQGWLIERNSNCSRCGAPETDAHRTALVKEPVEFFVAHLIQLPRFLAEGPALRNG